MSMTEQEAAMEEFIEEVSKEAVENFRTQRLVSGAPIRTARTFPWSAQIEESNDEEEHDLPVVRP